MKPTNPFFTHPVESIVRLTDRGSIENRRVYVTDAANNTRFALYPYIRGLLAAKVEQLSPTEQLAAAPVAHTGETSVADVPGSLNNVVNIMGQAEKRKLTAQEQQLAAAMRATEEAFEEPNHGIAA